MKNRREFAKIASAGALAAPLAVSAQEPDPPDEAQQLLELVKQRYPNENLDAEALTKIKNSITGELARAKRLAEFPLGNNDAPAFAFRAYRGSDG